MFHQAHQKCPMEKNEKRGAKGSKWNVSIISKMLVSPQGWAGRERGAGEGDLCRVEVKLRGTGEYKVIKGKRRDLESEKEIRKGNLRKEGVKVSFFCTRPGKIQFGDAGCWGP